MPDDPRILGWLNPTICFAILIFMVIFVRLRWHYCQKHRLNPQEHCTDEALMLDAFMGAAFPPILVMMLLPFANDVWRKQILDSTEVTIFMTGAVILFSLGVFQKRSLERMRNKGGTPVTSYNPPFTPANAVPPTSPAPQGTMPSSPPVGAPPQITQGYPDIASGGDTAAER